MRREGLAKGCRGDRVSGRGPVPVETEMQLRASGVGPERRHQVEDLNAARRARSPEALGGETHVVRLRPATLRDQGACVDLRLELRLRDAEHPKKPRAVLV